MLRLKYSCCGCSLRTGSILITIYFMFSAWVGINQNRSTLFQLVALILIALATVGFWLRNRHLLIPLIMMALFRSIWAVISFIQVITFGIKVIPKIESVVDVFEKVVDMYGKNSTKEEDFGGEQTNIDVVVVRSYALAQLIASVLNGYFFIVLLSYYFELKEEVLQDSARSQPMTRSITVAGSYGVDQMPQGESIVMENLHQRQTQISETSAKTKAIFVPVSDSVSH